MVMTIGEAITNNIFNRYKNTVNMSVKDLRRWDRDSGSKILRNNDRRNIKRNIELLKTKFKDWNTKHFRWANMMILNIKSIKKKKLRMRVGILSKKTILLKNNGFDRNKGRRR